MAEIGKGLEINYSDATLILLFAYYTILLDHHWIMKLNALMFPKYAFKFVCHRCYYMCIISKLAVEKSLSYTTVNFIEEEEEEEEDITN